MHDNTQHLDQYTPVDHVSHFSGIAVSVLYLLAVFATLWGVVARYVFDAPTQWAFEVVMVLVAACWMLSAGYITFRERHIAVTVISHSASSATQWKLTFFSNVVGIISLFLLAADSMNEAFEAVARVERAGSVFDSPMPTFLKVLLTLGATMYLAQLTVNLHRHIASKAGKKLVY